jgi:MGT family glycosyltransferase
MARILAYTSPARGHLFPLVPVLDELRARGHEIALRTLASQVQMARDRGFLAAGIDDAIERQAHDDYTARTPLGAQKRAMRTFGWRAELDAEDLREAIAREEPDMLLVDINAWGALAVAEKWGGPWASWCPYPLPLASRDAPPFGPGFRPSRSPLGQMRDAVIGPLTFGAMERIGRPLVNQVRERAGLSPLVDVRSMFESPPVLLYMTAEPFEYPRSDWPANIRLVGPCDWDPPARIPEWLETIERPIVLVTTSSEFQDDARLVRSALDGLANEPLAVIATLPAGDPNSFQGAHARVERFIPHRAVLDRAVCAITHGGMGATQKALAAGVPVCAVPFGRDQLEVARRVEVARAGSRLPASRLRPDRLRNKVREAIGRRDGARRIAEAYRATGGPAAAASACEQQLGAISATQPSRSR